MSENSREDFEKLARNIFCGYDWTFSELLGSYQNEEIDSAWIGYNARQPEIDALKQEIAALRTGDTCARHCEGTAYRIEAGKLKRENERLKARIGKMESIFVVNISDYHTDLVQADDALKNMECAVAQLLKEK